MLVAKLRSMKNDLKIRNEDFGYVDSHKKSLFE